MPVYSLEQIQALERAADASGHSYSAMMELAGGAVAEVVSEQLRLCEATNGRVAILAGPGNNGGDGLVAARRLAEAGHHVEVYAWKRVEGDPLVSSAQNRGATVHEIEESPTALAGQLSEARVVVDALFGTGLTRPIVGVPFDMMNALREARERHSPSRMVWATGNPDPQRELCRRPTIVAVDVPSGIHGDSGKVDPATIAADVTVTFAGPKPGMLTASAAPFLGALAIADIGIPPELRITVASQAMLLVPAEVRSFLPSRAVTGHKGTFGTTLIVGGSRDYVGAPGLSAVAAGRSGAGLVTIATPQPNLPILAAQPDLATATWLPLPHMEGQLCAEAVTVTRERFEAADAMVLGPGLGAADAVRAFVWNLLGLEQSEVGETVARPPAVVDADGLNALAVWPGDWWEIVRMSLVLTPHPAEMGRLLGCTSREIQEDRVEHARRAARRFNQVIVLKGAHTIVAAPDGRLGIAPYANDALSKAGSGDVLAGVIGALLGQGVSPFEAAALGVTAHGMAGELVRDRWGGRGALASDLLVVLPDIWKRLQNEKGNRQPAGNDPRSEG